MTRAAASVASYLHKFLRSKDLDELGFDVKVDETGGELFVRVSVIGITDGEAREIYDTLVSISDEISGFDFIRDDKYIRERP